VPPVWRHEAADTREGSGGETCRSASQELAVLKAPNPPPVIRPGYPRVMHVLACNYRATHESSWQGRRLCSQVDSVAEVLAPVHPPAPQPDSAVSPAASGFDFKQYLQEKAKLIEAALDASVPLAYPQDVTAAMRWGSAKP